MELALHPRQSDAFGSTATEILYGGAAGGGKSHLVRVLAIALAVAIPGIQIYLFRRTYPELWNNHMEGASSFPVMLADWTNQGFVKFNQQKLTYEFTHTQSKIHLCHCQHEKDMYAYDGVEFHVLLIEELTHWTYKIYSYLRSRVRIGGLSVPEAYKATIPRIVSSSNPGGVGHNWVKNAFIDNGPPFEVKQMAKEDGGLRRQFIPARLEDNPTMTENDPDYEARLESIDDPAMAKAKRWGDWDIVAGGALDDVWSRDRHVIAPFTIPTSWRVDRAFDWGSSKPFATAWFAESDGTEATLADGASRHYPAGTLFIIAELYGWNGTPDEGCKWSSSEIAREIKRIDNELPYEVVPGPADSSIYDVTDGNSIADEMQRQGVRWLRADKKPGSRVNGLQRLRGLLKNALAAQPEDPGLYVFDTCTHVIRTLPTLPRDARKIDDVDTHAEDHMYDAVRYRVLNTRSKATQSAIRI